MGAGAREGEREHVLAHLPCCQVGGETSRSLKRERADEGGEETDSFLR